MKKWTMMHDENLIYINRQYLDYIQYVDYTRLGGAAVYPLQLFTGGGFLLRFMLLQGYVDDFSLILQSKYY